MTDVMDEVPGSTHSSHWGAFKGSWQGDTLVITPHPRDPDPNPIIQNFPSALRHRARIDRPHVRRGWLERGPGKDDRRGRDQFVPMAWNEALDLVANELKRVRDTHGLDAIFGGSYGWASAGRFHHAQSQIHRFLNKAVGGYVRSVNSYSAGASNVMLPHILGDYDDVTRRNVSWDEIVRHTEIVLTFGGMATKNSRIAAGGISEHTERNDMARARERGTKFILVSPQRSDLPVEAQAEWLSLVPGTDVALMLGIAHTLVAENLHDRAFLDSHCTGWGVFEDYLMGRADGVAKTAAWAAPICGIAASNIAALARHLAGKRVLIVAAHSVQRFEHGEQPIWMAAVLASMLGQMGLPGGGYNYALGAVANYGKRQNAVPVASLPQGQNAVSDFIPVARISDMLLNPGKPFDYNGQRMSYPDIKLVYWAGGNPFHHHQDITRLRRGFFGIDTLVVHEIAWTATARHADIVLPCTMTLEREDIGATQFDQLMLAMHRLAKPFGEARDDYDIFADIAERLGRREAFTEGRSTRDWLRHLYATTQKALAAMGLPAPDFDSFWRDGELELPHLLPDGGILRAFRNDPHGKPLPTPSGKIEIFSRTIASFDYDDCPGHPVWLAPSETPQPQTPLHLVANQPASRLHSQFDFGGHSEAEKHRGREVMSIHPHDAAARGIKDGDIVRLFNARGACLGAARITDDIRQGVVRLPTGAWYDPEDADDDNPLCVHGNPNVLTRDIGTSSLAQGCSGQLTTVQVERFGGNLPPIRAFDPPAATELRAVTGRSKS